MRVLHRVSSATAGEAMGRDDLDLFQDRPSHWPLTIAFATVFAGLVAGAWVFAAPQIANPTPDPADRGARQQPTPRLLIREARANEVPAVPATARAPISAGISAYAAPAAPLKPDTAQATDVAAAPPLGNIEVQTDTPLEISLSTTVPSEAIPVPRRRPQLALARRVPIPRPRPEAEVEAPDPPGQFAFDPMIERMR